MGVFGTKSNVQKTIKLNISRRSEGGIAPVSGTGDRGFESRRFDQKNTAEKDTFSAVFFIHCESNGISSPLGVYHPL